MRPYKIIVVEDERITAQIIKSFLEKFGYEVPVIVETGEEAIIEAGKFNPELILMDINLAGKLDGIEAASEIRKRYNIPVIFITAYSDQETVMKVIGADPFGYIVKPFTDKDLFTSIKIAFARWELEQRLNESESKYRTLFHESIDAIYVIDESGKFIDFNSSMLNLIGYTKEQIMDLTIKDLCINKDDIKNLKKELEDSGFVKDYEIYLKKRDGSEICCIISTNNLNIKNNDTKKYYQGILRDITEKKTFINKLQNTIEGIVKAIILTVEAKDLYTAGHQVRVSNIAQKIAEIMELSAYQVEGIKMAGKVHDLGKIHVPAEILSKPSVLSVDEFEIVKTHPKVGYDILKIIDFPWPIADIVIQHHEREDGSGYPYGLFGNEIMIEAKILAVADVMEAMISHRPYRPALGVDLAIEELEKGRNSRFDPLAVDACVSIFCKNNIIIDNTDSEGLWINSISI